MRDPNLEWLEDFIEESINYNLNSKINYAEKKDKRTSNAGSSTKDGQNGKMDETSVRKSSSRKSRRGDDCNSNGEDPRK